MTARAVVRAAPSPDLIEIELADTPRCRGCEGVCLWRRLPRAARFTVRADQALGPGDAVVVVLPARYVLLGALLLYGLPLLALLCGAAAGAWAYGSDAGALLGAVAGIAAALLAAPRLRRRLEQATSRRLELRPVWP